MLGADQVEKSDLDESRKISALLVWKKGAEPIDQKNKKVKKRKYILMNPARFAPHPRVVHVWLTAAPQLRSAGRAGGAP